MSTPRRLGVSYSRFSDPHQAAGDSSARQERDYRRFCERHNLTPGKEVFADRGRSGYKDHHRTKGRLGVLIQAAKDRAFDPGTVIVIEAWDRLGRLRPDRQTDLVAELLRTGVSIGICRLDDIFCEEDFGSHKWTTLAVFIQLAYQESKQKADRLASSWAARRERARQTLQLTGHKPPGWIVFVDGKPKLIPERVAVIQRILQLAANGYGHARIIQTLHRERVPAFGERLVRPHRTRSDFAGVWTKSYVTKLLRDRRLVGEYQPTKGGKPDGDPIPGYYPAAASETEFTLARAGQAGRRSTRLDALGRQIAPRDPRHVNVFRDILAHARDGEPMRLSIVGNHGGNGTPGLKKTFRLINAKAVEGRADRAYTFPYFVFEEHVLGFLREIDPRTILPNTDAEASTADTLRRKLQKAREEIGQLRRELGRGFSKTLVELLREAEAREETVANDLQDELTRTAKPLARTWEGIPTLIDYIREHGDEGRLKLRPELRRVVESAHVLIVPFKAWRAAAVQFVFAGGAVRHWLILYRPAVNRRPTVAESRDFREATGPGPIDLRKAADVARVEKQLTKHLATESRMTARAGE
jgi:DNA invertase Pin-like site-specific DNA recombinase